MKLAASAILAKGKDAKKTSWQFQLRQFVLVAASVPV
jgi:hypothetical protein